MFINQMDSLNLSRMFKFYVYPAPENRIFEVPNISLFSAVFRKFTFFYYKLKRIWNRKIDTEVQ